MKKRNGEIDVMRFLVCIMIVVYHFCQVYGFDKFSIVTQGNIGVEFFFVVSGYLMAVSASKQSTVYGRELADDTWRFTINKVGNFYKYYIVGIILQVIIVSVGIKHTSILNILRGILQGIPQFTLTTMGLDYKHKSILFLSSSWYLSAMVLSSFVLYPMLRKFGDIAKKIIFPIGAVFIIGYIYATTDKLNNWDYWSGAFYIGFLRGISEMALGASLHALTETLSERFAWLFTSEKFAVKLLLTIFKYTCYLVFFLYGKGCNLGKYFSIHALLIVSLGIALSFMNVGYTIKESKLTRWLGKVSLPIYMFHGIFKTASPTLFPLKVGQESTLLLLAGVTVIICIVLYKLTNLLFVLLGKLGTAIRKKIEA